MTEKKTVNTTEVTEKKTVNTTEEEAGKKTGKYTTKQRRAEFGGKLREYEMEFGGIATCQMLFEGLRDFLVEKGIATELEIIKSVEGAVVEATTRNRTHKFKQRNMM